MLFSGTLQFNIDPFDHHSDDELWDALKHVHLKDFVASLPAELQHECAEAGGNFRLDIKQLNNLTFCLAHPHFVLFNNVISCISFQCWTEATGMFSQNLVEQN